jgi:hypothetical protein
VRAGSLQPAESQLDLNITSRTEQCIAPNPSSCQIYSHSHSLVLTGTKPACANQFPPVTVDKV